LAINAVLAALVAKAGKKAIATMALDPLGTGIFPHARGLAHPGIGTFEELSAGFFLEALDVAVLEGRAVNETLAGGDAATGGVAGGDIGAVNFSGTGF
jgi:hypothetical protein